jgi:hypothetical protein
MSRPNVYEIAPGRYALGIQNELAIAVVQREMRPGRPKYFGIRGRRPVIDSRWKRIAASASLRAELTRIAAARFN